MNKTNKFDMIIGYEGIKKELIQLVDFIRNPDKYKLLGARFPSGLLIHGAPGLGKTMMAKAFIEESGVKSYTVRRKDNMTNFLEYIDGIFRDASRNAPCIILLDDMDKFANTDDAHPNAEEFVVVQNCMDDIRDKDIMVVATVNDLDYLPESLLRAGRFDRKIMVEHPEGEEATSIIMNYLANKPVDEDVNFDDLAKMHDEWSCAELENAVNEAAIFAGHEGCDKIHMRHLVRATLRKVYDASDVSGRLSESERSATVFHEAGHAVVAEITKPGSVGMVTAVNCSRSLNGFTLLNGTIDFESNLLITLGGMAASEIVYPGEVAKGCSKDLDTASRMIARAYRKDARYGFFGNTSHMYINPSENYNFEADTVISIELKRSLLQAKKIINDNFDFFTLLAKELGEKETLLHSDIKRIREASSSAVA